MNAVYNKKEDVVTRRIAGENIIVPVSGELAAMQKIFSVDSVADYIWHALDGRKRIADILEGISESFDVEPEIAEKDLVAFIQELLNEGLVIEVADEV